MKARRFVLDRGLPVVGVGGYWIRARCLALSCVAVLGCAAPRTVSPSLPTAADPSSVMRIVGERSDRVETLRARFTAKTRHGGNSRTADGVLLVRKPDQFRLRLTAPFGLTVFDYLSLGDRVQVVLPLEGRVMTGPLSDDQVPFSRDDLGRAFLRGSLAFPATCRVGESKPDEMIIVCPGAGGSPGWQIRIDPRTGRIREETSYEAGRIRRILRFAEYRITGDADLPHRITLTYPGQGLKVDIEVHRYEVNIQLDDDLFRLSS